MYKGYWPNAVAAVVKLDPEDGSRYILRKVIRLTTYQSCDSLEEAKLTIANWENHFGYKILSSYIEHSWDKRKVQVKIHENNVRKLEWGW